jgi:hypothetical protein
MSEFVKGQCPLCGSGVFVGSSGWLTCSGSECPDPLFVGEIFEKYKESNSNLGELMRIVKQLEAMTVPAPRPHYFVQEEDEVVATCLHCGETDDGEETSNCEPVPAPRLECPTNHTWLNHNVPGAAEWEPWAAKGYNYCPDCGTALSPPVGPTKRNRGRNGVILACGCWTANVLVGMRAGADAVQCPNGHGSSLIAEANIDEFAPPVGTQPEGN